MWEILWEPLGYAYMLKAMLLSGLVGGVCAFLSAYLMLKGWSLIGDALSHAVVPGVALSYVLGLPYAVGAFFSGLLAALAIWWIKSLEKMREDAVIGLVFTTFFALGLFIVSLNPAAVSVQEIIFGNILAVSNADLWQVVLVMLFALILLLLFWKDLLLVFFDEVQARSVGLSPQFYQMMFFVLLSACVLAALQTVGAILVMAMVITPGAAAYLLSDKFRTVAILAVLFGSISSVLGVYLSYFIDGATGAVIVCLQSLIFLVVFLFSPKYGLWKINRKIRGSAV